MHVNAPSARTLEDSENGDADHHLYTNTYPYDNLSEDDRRRSSLLLGGKVPPSTVSRVFTVIMGICTTILFFASIVAMVGVVELRHSVDKVGFSCPAINTIGVAVLAASVILFLLSLIVIILTLKGTLGNFHASAFDPYRSRNNGGSCCNFKKVCAVMNLIFVIVFTAVILVGALLSFSFFRLSTQVVSTEPRTLTGLDGNISLVRDKYGLPRVHANSKRDAFFAQGYAQAEDRLWELEFTRLVVQGRLAEKLGKPALKTDKQTRNLGFRRAAESMCDLASNTSKELMQNFVNGINHYLATRKERPVEFAFMGKPPAQIVPQMRLFSFYEPEPFDYYLVCYAAKLIQWEMAGDAQTEAQRFQVWWMNPDRSMDEIAQLYNNYTNVSHTILNAEELKISGQDVEDRQRDMYNTFMAEVKNYENIFDKKRQSMMKIESSSLSTKKRSASSQSNTESRNTMRKEEQEPTNNNKFPTIFDFRSQFASNGWAARDANNNAAGASDPHLQITLPSVWHQIHLQWGGTEQNPNFAVSGVALCGMAGIGIGKRLDVFWAITAGQTDTEDLFVLNQTSPDSDTYYVQKDPSNPNGEYVALTLTTRTEVIKVLGESDVVLNIKESIYGSDVTDVFFDTATSSSDDDSQQGDFVWTNLPGATQKQQQTAPFRFHMYSPVFRPDNSSADAFASTLDENTQTAVDMRIKVCSQLASPSFSITIGDSTGGLTYSLTGHHQQRQPDHWGRWPHFATQNEDSYYKQKIIPFEEKPSRTVAPGFSSTFIGTANQKVYPDGYQYDLGASFDPGYRGRRIQTLMAETDPSKLGDLDTHRSFQQDHYSGIWLYAIKPFVQRHNTTFSMPPSRYSSSSSISHFGLTQQQVNSWKNAQLWINEAGIGNANFDGLASVGSTQISFVWKWIQEYSSIAAPLTKKVTGSDWWNNWLFIDKSVNGQAPQFVENVLCQNYLIANDGWYTINNRNEFFNTSDLCSQAFIVAFLKMSDKHLTDDGLRWAQDLKPFHAQNRMMTTTPLKCMFDRFPEKDGDTTSLDVSDFSIQSENFVSTAASSMRHVYSSKVGQSHYMYFVMPGGASGNPYDWRYTNLMEMWRTEQYIETVTSKMN